MTNENSGKAFVDYKPWTWLTARASWIFADRRYDTYDYRGFVGNAQWTDPNCTAAVPTGCNVQYSTAMRQFYLDNRQRNIGKVSVAVDVLHGLTVTPTFGYQEDDYSIGETEVGLVRSQAIKSGVELAYAFDPWTNGPARLHERAVSAEPEIHDGNQHCGADEIHYLARRYLG